MITTETLIYSHREDDIKAIAQALDLLGHKDVLGAIEVLMAYRDQLIESQIPVRKQYDPQKHR